MRTERNNWLPRATPIAVVVVMIAVMALIVWTGRCCYNGFTRMIKFRDHEVEKWCENVGTK